MNSFLKYAGIGLGVLITFVGIITLVFLVQAGQFKSLEPQFAGSCSAIEGNGSAEDLVIDPDTALVYISDFDRPFKAFRRLRT